jgi:DNA-binding CsgD family transcriptional regulator
MSGAVLERIEREVSWLCQGALAKDAFCRAVGERLADAIPYDGSCWHTIDPSTLLITSHLTEGIPDVDFPALAFNEYVADDVNTFASLAQGRRRVATLHGATFGKPQRSLRHRAMLRPRGFDAELRASFVSRSSCWGSLILVREAGHPDFTREQRALLARLAPRIAEGLRRALLLAAARRSEDEAGLVMVGRTTPQIGASLFISPHTVQDHLKAIFEKVGVHSRKELVGHVFFEHYLPGID